MSRIISVSILKTSVIIVSSNLVKEPFCLFIEQLMRVKPGYQANAGDVIGNFI
jgi:hypothetical protein